MFSGDSGGGFLQVRYQTWSPHRALHVYSLRFYFWLKFEDLVLEVVRPWCVLLFRLHNLIILGLLWSKFEYWSMFWYCVVVKSRKVQKWMEIPQFGSFRLCSGNEGAAVNLFWCWSMWISLIIEALYLQSLNWYSNCDYDKVSYGFQVWDLKLLCIEIIDGNVGFLMV